MAPEFALSLSHDGIDLLHNGSAGWQIVAQADPASPELTEQMQALRASAEARAKGGLDANIILPDDQIKYLTLETSGLDQDASTALIRQTLDETTPYAADEIIFDRQQEGDAIYVAAVAKDTLAEAESFARQFGFSPVAYLAQPFEDRTFVFVPFEAAPKLPGEMASSIAALKQAGTAETEAPETSDYPAPASDPISEFVSRRRVPTFKTDVSVTEAPDVPEPSGLEEPAEPFAAQAAKTSAQPSGKARTPEPGQARARTETERMTLFGMRTSTGLKQGLGARGTAIAIAAVAAMGLFAFANTALGTNLASFIALLNAPKPTAQFTAPLQPQFIGTDTGPAADNTVELASLNTSLTAEDEAVLNALRAPVLDSPAPRSDRTTDEVRAAYAVTGIWPLAPDVPSSPALIDLDNLYETSIDPIEMNFDAVALPAIKSYQIDAPFLGLSAPAPAGTTFALDERGFVIPTPQGALNPDGIPVFAGQPPVRQPNNLLRIEEPGEDLTVRLRIAGFRPQARPDDLIETSERATLGGLTRTELAQVRPRLRPASAQEAAFVAASLVPLDEDAGRPLVAIDADLLATATARAVPVSLRPDARPVNFAAVVEQARPKPAAPAATQVAAASVAPRVVAPSIPSSASVSREATIKNALNLRKVNLIGVYGKPSSRRALVRLGNGRYRKVEVGDRIDGGRISAIGDAELRYQKSGRDVVLKMPRG